MVKRLLSSCLAVLMLVTAFSSFTALASTEVTVPSSLVNVSYGKTIADSQTAYANEYYTDASKVLDGVKNTDAGWIGTNTNYFVVDLGRAYKIDKVTIYERNTAGPYRGQFIISATNDDPTGESVTWTELNNSNITPDTNPSISEVFPEKTSYSPTLKNNSTEFRYIKYAGKSTAYVSEFEVFSDVAASQNTYTATKFINVAKHKPTTSSLPTSDHANVVDDDFYNQGNAWHVGGSWYNSNPDVTPTKPWVKIDLLRQYDIEKIVLYDRADSSQAMRSQFELYGTNNPDATEADWEKIFFATDDENLTNDLANTFPAKGCYAIPVTDKNYRYIIYKSTNGNNCSIREIQVFANVNVFEVTRGTGAASIGSYPGNQAANGGKGALTDGNLGGNAVNGESTNDFRSGQHATFYTMLTFDLGKAYNIGLIEINPMTRSVGLGDHDNIAFYGTNTKISDYTVNYADTGKAYQVLDSATFMTATSSVKLGAHVTYMRDTVFNDKDGNFVYQQIWSKDAANNTASTRPAYHLPLNNTQNYRYLTMRKETINTRFSASEFAAYVIRPDAFGVTVANKKAYVNFSDYNMDPASINAANIKVYNAEGVEQNVTPTLSGTQAVIDIESLPAGNYKVAIGQGVMNTYGTTLAEGKIFDFKVIANKLTVTGFEAAPAVTDNTATLSITASNGTTSPETLFVAVALYDGTKLIGISEVAPVPVAADSDVTVTRTATVPEAYRTKVITAKAFCWYNGTLKPFSFE